MSDGPDDHNDQHRDELHDEELSRRYRTLPVELPHPDTDAVIQAAARQALAEAKRKPRAAAFYSGLAMAASVTLVMAVLLPSWRSGRLHEEVAVQAPAPITVAPEVTGAVVAPAAPDVPSPPVATPTAPVQASARLAPQAPPARTQEARALAPQRQGTAARPAIAAAPPAEAAAAFDVPQVRAVAPALASPAAAAVPMVAEEDAKQEAAGAPAPASAEREAVADRAREETVVRQKARMAMAPAPKQALATDDLLLAGRYAEALAALQTGTVATDSSFDSRRDLLRQLLPGEAKALQCQAGTGPASAQALCRLLQQYQAVQQGRAERRVLGAAQEALRQALQAEGRDPAPLLQAIADLPGAP